VLQENWSGPAAELAAQLLTRFRLMKAPTSEAVDAFCREIWGRVVTGSAKAVLSAALDGYQDQSALIDHVCEGRPRVGLVELRATPAVPLIAVGGPARIYYEEVGKRLGCEVIFTDHFQVANAVGAAAGVVGLRVTVTIEGDGSGSFRVFSPDGTRLFASGEDALAFARATGREIALRDAKARGAKLPELHVEESKSYLPDAFDDNGLLSARIVVEAVGKV
jgi:hypothetical protein